MDASLPVPTVMAATWNDGLFVLSGGGRRHELAGQAVGALARDGRGGTLAVIDDRTLCRRTAVGTWSTVATSELRLECAMQVGEVIYVGTNGAHLLRIGPGGGVEQLHGFDVAPDRDSWYAGTALVDGEIVGPPLSIRSLTTTCDGRALLANVHVGGILRSTDGGATWHPTIEIDCDVHEVCAHPSLPGTVFAAAAVGLCMSLDGGATWAVESDGLDASYCSAVAVSRADVLVSASAHHFADRGAIYRRSVEGPGPLVPLGSGLPRWLDGIADTRCVDSNGSAIAVADKAGNVYASPDAGVSWERLAEALPSPSGVLIT